MGEARRKKQAAEARKREGKDWRTSIAMIAVVLVTVIPVWLVSHVLGQAGKPVHNNEQTQEQKEGNALVHQPSSSVTTRTVVLDTAEEFMAYAEQLNGSTNPIEQELALTHWRAAVGKAPTSNRAWRGYAKASVSMLLGQYKLQPHKVRLGKLEQMAQEGSAGFLAIAPRDPLAYELAAYAAAFRGDEQQALMHATSAQMHAEMAGMRQSAPTLIPELIMIANQRKNAQTGIGGW